MRSVLMEIKINSEIKLSDIFSKESFNEMQDSISNTYGIACASVDINKPFTKESNFSEFCKLTRSTKEGCKRCINCNLASGKSASEYNVSTIYTCHAGLTAVAVPIMLEKKHIGSILGGQVLTEDLNEEIVKKTAKEIGVDEEKYLEAARKVRYIDFEELEKFISVLGIFANSMSKLAYSRYLLIKENAKKKLVNEITKTIIDENIDEDIMKKMSTKIAKFFDADRILLIEFDKGKDKFDIKHDIKFKESIKSIKEAYGEKNSDKIVKYWQKLVFEKKTKLSFSNIDDIPVLEEVKEKYKNLGFKSALMTIIEENGNKKVVLVMAKYYEIAEWSDDTQIYLDALGKQMNIAFAKVKMNEKIEDLANKEKALLNNIPFAIWLKDDEGRFLAVNDAYYNEIDVKDKNIIGKTAAEISGLNEVTKGWQEEDDIVRKSKKMQKFVKKYKFKNREIWAESYKTPILNEDGEVYAITGMVRDISKEKEMENLKNEFISVISHELRTPLTSIGGSIELILNNMVGEITPQTRNMLEIANKNSKRLAFLINNILDLEGLESDTLAFNFEKINAKNIIEDTIQNVKKTYESLNLEINENISLKGEEIYVDKFRFVQILENILSNAYKFTVESQAISISVTQNKQNIEIKITNFGKPLNTYKKEELFEKFYQEDASNVRKKNGIGLGLTISKLLMDKMSGNIDVKSENGQNTFTLTLPLCK